MPTDILILGAGPAGAATALKLSHLGIATTIVDKATFPRDKICGDALSGKIPTLLDRMDPEIMNRFRAKYRPTSVWGIRFTSPQRKVVDLPFRPDYQKDHGIAPGYVSKRIDFDNFLVEEVRRREDIDLQLETEITEFERTAEGWTVRARDGRSWDCKLLIDGMGAHSKFSRHEAGQEVDKSHHAAAIRTYYRGVTGFKDNFIELHFVKSISPGYFWIFPLPNGEANVGLGVRSDVVAKRKMNLRKALDEIVASDEFRDRFKNAELIDPPKGYGLPLGSKERTLSGDNYLLIGDAGHLIDPLTGEGIGNGVYSGIIAAELAEKCLAEGRFDADYLAAYDVRIERVLRKELRVSYRLQRVIQHTWIANVLTFLITTNPGAIDLLCRMYTDLELRSKVVTPRFWWDVIRRQKKSPKPV